MSFLTAIILFGLLSGIFVTMREIKRARDAKRMSGELEQLITRISRLREAIEVMHRCKATHVESVSVIEMSGKKPV